MAAHKTPFDQIWENRHNIIVIVKYSQSSCKQPPREFEKVVVTRAGRLREIMGCRMRPLHKRPLSEIIEVGHLRK